MKYIKDLETEKNNTNTRSIDLMSTIDIVKIINDEDKKIAVVISDELEAISKAIDAMVLNYRKGGRLIYVGAGTSGRLGIADAAELKPTFGIPDSRAFGIIAGGEKALIKAAEGCEDDTQEAINELRKYDINENDIIIGLSASGRTPFTNAALIYGNSKGALTVSVTCNKEGIMNKTAQYAIAPNTGAEVISGSTRMKAGTAQKMVLNMLSTGLMIKCGYVYQNFMVRVIPSNNKLDLRSKNIIQQILGCNDVEAEDLYEQSGHNVALAIIIHDLKVDRKTAEELYQVNDGNLRKTLQNNCLKH